MKRITFLAPRDVAEDLPGFLQKLALVHLEDFTTRLPADELARGRESSAAAESHLKQIELVESVFAQFAPAKKGFLAGLVNAPLLVEAEEVHRTVREFDIEPFYRECRHAFETHREFQRRIEHAEAEMATLEFFRRLPFRVADARALRRTAVWVGSFNEIKWDAFGADEWAREHLAVEELFRRRRTVYAAIVAVDAERAEAAAVLKRHDFAQRPLPELDGPEVERLDELRAQVEDLRVRSDELVRRIVALAEQRRRVALLRVHWEGELARVEAANGSGATARIVIFTGYVRAKDAPRLGAALEKKFPRVSLLLEDPTPEDHVPVSLELGPVVRPMRMLVGMFGMPDYFSFDPTPFLSISFLVFFGSCFGDVFYGLMLCGVAGFLAWKARRYGGGLLDLCMILLYGGISTMIVGMLTGTWAGDLWKPEYLGEGNLLLRIKNATAIVDPLDKAVLVLLISLLLGVMNQLYGVTLKGYGLLRRGDVAGALFDAGLWLIALPAFLVVVSKLFVPTPAWLFQGGVVVLLAAAVGLVLTQGRKEPSLAGKAITGLVSLYGILGGYGCVTFVGDTLSYARLLALGLTTAIIGMSVNVMADLVRDVPVAGGVLFVVVLVVGHTLNFAVCILGAFVHSARLIFLEFFGRFYDAQGVRFRPLSLSTDRALVVDSRAPGG